MNKSILMAFVAVLGLIFMGSVAFTQESTTVVPLGSSWSAFEAGWLIGHQVYNPGVAAGAGLYDLGQITALVLDQTNDRVSLVILSDVPGLGAEKVALPFESIQRVGPDTFTFRFPEDKLALVDMTGGDCCPFREAMLPTVVPATIDKNYADFVYNYYEVAPYWTASSAMHPERLVVYDGGSRFVGRSIETAQGSVAGQWSDLVIDPDGHIAFVVLSDVPGRTADTMIAVPYRMVSRSGDIYAVDITPDKLASAPVFDRIDLRNRLFAADVYAYFGVQPYWTESGM
jgi:sporulation protein YlmC with PRC-barrel domain